MARAEKPWLTVSRRIEYVKLNKDHYFAETKLDINRLISSSSEIMNAARREGVTGVANAYKRLIARLKYLRTDGHAVITLGDFDKLSSEKGTDESPDLWLAHAGIASGDDEE